MGQVQYTHQARQDLIDIGTHIAADSLDTALQCLDRIETRCLRLATFPELGPARPDLAPGVRMLVVERWVALYRLIEEGVEIVRVLDGTRDISRVELPK